MLGIVFRSDDIFGFDNFYLFGFLGYIVIILYFIFIIKNIKNSAYDFKFSIVVLVIYLFFVLKYTFEIRGNITCFNQVWPIPFILSIIVEIIIYYIKKIRNKNNRNE